MERRNLLDQVSGLAFGAAVDPQWLLSLFPSVESTGTRRVGLADVVAIEQATDTYVRQDYATGSGPVRDGAVFHLRAVLPLLNAQISDEVRPRLMIATARLAMVTGWMSFDVLQHDAARQLWVIGLGLARGCAHPLGSDLAIYLLHDMAHQALQVGHPDEALKLVHIGEAAAVGPHPVSASTASALSGILASAHAARGDTRACERALHQAQEQFASIDPQASPPWGGYSTIGLAANQGGVHYALARAERDTLAASRAVPLLRHAVDGLDPSYGVPRALNLAALAGAHALTGDVDTAVTVGHQAVDAITALHSPRAYQRLHVLHTVLEPMHTSPGVAELRDRLSIT
ncbi:MAG: hypothetical protein JO115_17265 [Pseudonocardiales bacterium]|nr:hypothetical protein [Pseudonocardiales bacterium]